MFDYLVKFNKLPKELKDRVSTPLVMSAIDQLEEKYRVNLATVVMKIMVGEIAFDDLIAYFIEEFSLDSLSAGQLKFELAQRVFAPVADYLGLDLASLRPPAAPGPLIAEPMTPLAERPAPPAGGVRGSSFFFSSEDEEEIRNLSRHVSAPDLDSMKLSAEQAEAKLTLILERAEINFGGEALAERFKQILRTHLRGIRKRLETKFSLTKAYNEGGLDFDEESADKVLAIADKVLAEPAAEIKLIPLPKIKVPEDEAKKSALTGLKEVGARDIEYDLAKELKKSRPAEPSAAAELKTRAVVEPLLEISKLAGAAPSSPAAPLTVKPPFEADRIKARPLAEGGGKIRMTDVKFVPKSLEPVDELKYLDLISFRRWDKDPFKAALKIKERINLLEEEHYGKKMEGIKAWRQSPVNRLYLAIGSLAIGKNKPIDIIIEERRSAGEEYLNSQEFEAIMNLNKELRF